MDNILNRLKLPNSHLVEVHKKTAVQGLEDSSACTTAIKDKLFYFVFSGTFKIFPE